VTARTPEPGFLGVDVGGTTIKAVRLSASGDVVAEHRLSTPGADGSGHRLVEAVDRAVRALGGSDGRPVGVVIPGVIDEDRGVVVGAGNLGLRDAPVRARLQERLAAPVALGHDARAAATAEARSGAARAVEGTVAFVAIGTGLGSAVLVDGRPLVSGGWAGEISQVVLSSGPHAGRRVEEVASATALATRAGAADAAEVARRVAQGDPAAAALWADTVAVLAEALAWLSAVVAPTAIVVGGGLSRSGSLLLDPLSGELGRRLGRLRVPSLLPAAHGDLAGALGAALMAADLDRGRGDAA
jgi:glucokinase